MRRLERPQIAHPGTGIREPHCRLRGVPSEAMESPRRILSALQTAVSTSLVPRGSSQPDTTKGLVSSREHSHPPPPRGAQGGREEGASLGARFPPCSPQQDGSALTQAQSRRQQERKQPSRGRRSPPRTADPYRRERQHHHGGGCRCRCHFPASTSFSTHCSSPAHGWRGVGKAEIPARVLRLGAVHHAHLPNRISMSPFRQVLLFASREASGIGDSGCHSAKGGAWRKSPHPFFFLDT